MSYAVGSRYVSAYGTLDCHCLSSDAEPKLERVAIIAAIHALREAAVQEPPRPSN
jgi:hypothetical protein